MKAQPLNTPVEFMEQVRQIIRRALQEDIGEEDITTKGIVPPFAEFKGELIAKEQGVVAGLEIVKLTFAELNSRIKMTKKIDDGQEVKKGDIIATFHGDGQTLLSGERVALNFLQRMSGIASITRRFVVAVQHTDAIILDTRKTVPGLRILDKWAVRLGGGQNHRAGLYDMFLIKENHIAAAGSLSEAVARVRLKTHHHHIPIEVEVKNMRELREALGLGVDRILLDNMNLKQLRQAVEITAGRIPLEASGNVNLENVSKIAETGVNYISVGMLTHSVRAMDISFILKSNAIY